MPEGPEVKCIADQLKKAEGYKFYALRLNSANTNYRYNRKNPDNLHLLNNISTPKQLLLDKVSSHGKLIKLSFYNEYTKQHWTILNTLGMSGTWKYVNQNQDWDNPGPKHSRFFLRAEQQAPPRSNGPISVTAAFDLVFVDPRCFGTIRILSPEKADLIIKKTIGLDPLNGNGNNETWKALKTKKSIANLPIGELLLKQKFIAGIGNIYRAEILYLSRMNPWTRVSDISQDGWLTLWHNICYCLQRAYTKGGTTFHTFEANGNKGEYTPLIYGRKECNSDWNVSHPVSQALLAGRTMWWCESCQPRTVIPASVSSS